MGTSAVIHQYRVEEDVGYQPVIHRNERDVGYQPVIHRNEIDVGYQPVIHHDVGTDKAVIHRETNVGTDETAQ